jgi:hypothetical protein
MKLIKIYDKEGNLVYWHADLTMAESQPDWIEDGIKQRKAKERKKRSGTSK